MKLTHTVELTAVRSRVIEEAWHAGPDANGYGGVFKGGASGWSELVNFPENEGGLPFGGVALDASENLYGTTSVNGPGGGGNVWEITP